jgi:2-polyprenyl-3-methyl-5-hydroxy-6-metoxy-1,4-benzoquinol methylase
MSEPGKPPAHDDRRYYEHAGKIPFARRLSALARRRVYDLFLRTMQPSATDRILDIGATDDAGLESNMLEQLYPHRKNITCVSLTNGKAILAAYPGVQHVQITLGQPLPFEPDAFDIVYCNAVLEHVGSRERQKEFIADMCRVAPRRFLAVPNRRFPVEHHTGLPFIHWLPPAQFRKLLRGGRYDVWSREENLNYISASEILRLWPAGGIPSIAYSGVGLGPWKSNLVVYQA